MSPTKCCVCGRSISVHHYKSDQDVICRSCGDKKLIECPAAGGYVFADEYREAYTDDQLVDVVVYQKEGGSW